MHPQLKKASLALMCLLFGLSVFAQAWEERSLNGSPHTTITTRLVDWDDDGDLDIIGLQSTGYKDNKSERSWAGQLVCYQNDFSQSFPLKVIAKSFTLEVFESSYFKSPSNFEIADLDRNGKKDILLITNGISWYQSQADGTYLQWTIKPNRQILGYELADLNQDGNLDVLASFRVGKEPSRVAFFINDGAGNFREVPMLNGTNIEDVKTGDVNNDGKLDLVATTTGWKAGFKVFYGTGELNFAAPLEIDCKLWDNIRDFRLDDYNLDGHVDICAVLQNFHYEIMVLDGSQNFKKNPNFKISPQYHNWANSGYASPVDFDQDGFLDCLYAKPSNGVIQIHHHDQRIEILDRGFDVSFLSMMTIGDLDGDGDLDIVYTVDIRAENNFTWLENIDGKFYAHMIAGVYEEIHDISVMDYDLDGDEDIFLACADEDLDSTQRNGVYLFENRGNGIYKDWFIMSLDHEIDGVQYFDVDQDGDLDIVGLSPTRENIQICLNNLAPHKWKVQNAVPQVHANKVSVAFNNNNLQLLNWNQDEIELDVYTREKGQDEFIKTSLDLDVGPIVYAQLLTPEPGGKTYLVVLSQDTAQTLTVFDIADDWELSVNYTFKGYYGMRTHFLTSKTKQKHFVFSADNEEDTELFILLFEYGKFTARQIYVYKAIYGISSTWVSLTGDELYFQDEDKYYKISLSTSDSFQLTPLELPKTVDPFLVLQVKKGEVQQLIGNLEYGKVSIFRKKP